MSELSPPRETHLLIRGDFLRKDAVVEPDTPEFLPKLATPDRRRTRVDLAKWLVDRRNPLTARVTTNRIWSRYFPAGIVETENDFGLQGTPPSHQELLDWLASELMDRGWSQKYLQRLILTSATYQQSADHREDSARIDPLNKLLSRQARLRVDAEVVRDLALSVSGLLVSRIGGPSVYPPQPDGVYAFTQRQAAWPTSQGADRYRRGIYTFFMRSAPYPLLTTFDTPRFNTSCTARTRSNTPLQSLTLSNDETMLEMARSLAVRIQQAGSTDEERIAHAYELCLARAPAERESDRLRRFVDQQRGEFDIDQARVLTGRKVAESSVAESDVDLESIKELAVWTMVARVMLNLDEFIVRQ